MKAYAISALMKINAFELAAGRKVEVLPEVYAERLVVFIVQSINLINNNIV